MREGHAGKEGEAIAHSSKGFSATCSVAPSWRRFHRQRDWPPILQTPVPGLGQCPFLTDIISKMFPHNPLRAQLSEGASGNADNLLTHWRNIPKRVQVVLAKPTRPVVPSKDRRVWCLGPSRATSGRAKGLSGCSGDNVMPEIKSGMATCKLCTLIHIPYLLPLDNFFNLNESQEPPRWKMCEAIHK